MEYKGVTLLELANALGTAVTTGYFDRALASSIMKKYLRDSGLLEPKFSGETGPRQPITDKK